MGEVTMNGRQQAQYLTHQAFALVSQGLQARSQGEFAFAARLFENALQPLALALEADPTYAHAHNERAFVLFRLQRLDEAAESARRAASLAPHVPKFHQPLIDIGLERMRLQKSRQARKCLSEIWDKEIEAVITKFPGYPSGFLAQADLRAMTGVGQSLWEASLSEAARVYFAKRKMSSGEPATESAIADVMKRNTIKCFELAREWDRLPE
jgi:tetratricopeptide (TPR) repeat protein